MHPAIAELHVEQRRAELQQIAERARLRHLARHHDVCTPARYTVRQRIGWFLVERGLQLICD